MLSGHAQTPQAESYTETYIELPQNSSTIPSIPSGPKPEVVLARANPPAQESASVAEVKPLSDVLPAGQQKKEASSEAAELLKMATALKTEVDKTTKDTLSVAVVRKAGEIEQLAHKVRLGAGKD